MANVVVRRDVQGIDITGMLFQEGNITQRQADMLDTHISLEEWDVTKTLLRAFNVSLFDKKHGLWDLVYSPGDRAWENFEKVSKNIGRASSNGCKSIW